MGVRRARVQTAVAVASGLLSCLALSEPARATVISFTGTVTSVTDSGPTAGNSYGNGTFLENLFNAAVPGAAFQGGFSYLGSEAPTSLSQDSAHYSLATPDFGLTFPGAFEYQTLYWSALENLEIDTAVAPGGTAPNVDVRTVLASEGFLGFTAALEISLKGPNSLTSPLLGDLRWDPALYPSLDQITWTITTQSFPGETVTVIATGSDFQASAGPQVPEPQAAWLVGFAALIVAHRRRL